MTNISKKQLPKKELDRLFAQLNTVIGRLKGDSVNDFLQDLLGPEERIMIAKRFAIIVLLAENYSTYRIAQKMKVSTSTVENLRQKQENGEYDHLLTILCHDKVTFLEVWATLDSALHLGGLLPHRIGLDRYRSFKK